MLTDPKKALVFAGVIVFGVIMTVDSNSGETAFDSTDPDFEYVPPREEADDRREERLFGQSEGQRDEPEEFGDIDDAGDLEGFDPTPEEIKPTNPLFDGERRYGSRNAATRPPGIDGPNT